MDRVNKEFHQSVSGNIEDKGQYNACGKEDKKEPVLFWMYRIPLQGEHECSGEPCKYINENKINDPHVRQPEKITQRIFGETGNKEKDERDIYTFMRDEMIKSIDIIFLYDPFDKT